MKRRINIVLFKTLPGLPLFQKMMPPTNDATIVPLVALDIDLQSRYHSHSQSLYVPDDFIRSSSNIVMPEHLYIYWNTCYYTFNYIPLILYILLKIFLKLYVYVDYIIFYFPFRIVKGLYKIFVIKGHWHVR